MRYFLTLITLCLFTFSAWAQPLNDDCGGLIDLGLAPTCSDDIYTNIDATSTNIGLGNIPDCFNGGIVPGDVFFSFTVDPSMPNLTISVIGSAAGPNAMSIVNPQIALYRGSCMFNGLALLACASADLNETTVHLDAIGLTPGVPYFIRINDYTDTGTPNWGDFQVCVEEFIPEINIGTVPSSESCFGTLFDSGGPDADYASGENHTFTVCPNDFTQCMAIDLISFGMEEGADFLNIYGGNDTSAPLLSRLTGTSNGNDFDILIESACVTFQFTSDGSVTNEGFELTWECSDFQCDASPFDNAIEITGLPYSDGGFSTCGPANTLVETPCDAAFLGGPQTVFAYTSKGGYCASVVVAGAEAGTGIMVLNGLPDDPETVCTEIAANGSAASVDFQTPGVYYIVVANPFGCTEFGMSITEAPCTLSPALVDALCNPLNGCAIVENFMFEDGFQDIPLNPGLNDGCWGGVGAEPDYYWFTIEAQADGPFGFILESANNPSDIDFNVWGPFTTEQTCETPQVIIDAVTNTQPLRSSWDGGTEPTGLADVHPTFGYAIEDVYDCNGLPDDIVQTIAAQEGEVYVVLANDWGNQIEEGGILVDWGPSDPAVLAPISSSVSVNDTSVCIAEPVVIDVITGIDNIQWIGDNLDELSCIDCFSPTATPLASRTYRAILRAVCYTDTISVNINVFDLDAGPDLTNCVGEEFDIPAGQNFGTAVYAWSPPAGLDFSCIDCPTPSVISQVPGTYEVPVTLTAEACSFMDMVTITVLDTPAPIYTIAENDTICAGESILIGGPTVADQTYAWTAVPATAPIDPASNVLVVPDTTTTYFLSVSNNQCPSPSIDSVTITVAQYPMITIAGSTDPICEGETISLTNTPLESDVNYTWTGGPTILNPDSIFTEITPLATSTYTLTGDRLGCTTEASVEIVVTPISLDLNQPDTLLFCLGDEVTLSPTVAPDGAIIQWNVANVTGNTPTLSPADNTTYIATVDNGACVLMDTLYIQVDSIPLDMTITADPMEDFYCQGELVQLTSPIYEPANFPNIIHTWEGPGMETPDSLYNLVLTTVDTFSYIRTTTSGVCMNSDTITLNVITNEMLTITPSAPELCPGESVDLLVTSPALGELEWDPAGSLSCSNCPNPTASPSATTIYTVTSTIEDCPVETSVEVMVADIPGFNIIGDQVACDGASFDLNLGPFNDPSVVYLWTSSTDPAFMETTGTITVEAGTPTTYSVTASNACGTISDEVFIAQASAPIFTLPEDLTVCLESSFNLSAILENDEFVTSMVWIYDGESEIGSSVDFIGTNSGVATFNVEYGSPDGTVCDILMGTVNINVVDQIYTVDIESDPAGLDTISISNGTNFTLNGLVDPPTDFDYTYNWSGNGVEMPNSQLINLIAPTFADPMDTTTQMYTYTLLVSTPEGCDQMADITINVVPSRYKIPNIFSPNGDDMNPTFKIFTNDMPSNYSMKIFSRWGQLVFETTDPAEGWDGNIDGNPSPSDIYIYEMTGDATFGPISERGQVTLMR